MVKYNGRFVVEDKANDKKYLADTLFESNGEDLALWTIDGTMLPTAVGKYFDLFNNNGVANGDSWMRYQLPNTNGMFNSVAKCKFMRMADDTSLDWFAFTFSLSHVNIRETGICYAYDAAASVTRFHWRNSDYLGPSSFVAATAFVPGQEYEVALITTPLEVVLILDGVRKIAFPVGSKGDALPPKLPLKDFNTINKTLIAGVRHQAAETSHIRVRDIKVGRLVGVSW